MKKHDPVQLNRALALYVMGKSVPDVSKVIDVPIPTVVSWVRKYRWSILKKEASIITQEKVTTTVTDAMVDETRRHLDLYKKMQEKGDEELDIRSARSAGEAGDLADRGIKGERTIMAGLVSRRLISLLAKIIQEEINDPVVRERVALKLKDIFNAEVTEG